MPPAPTPLLESLRSRLDEAREFLKELVDVNSFTANRDGVNRVAQITADAFAGMGFSIERVASENRAYGDHLFLRREPPGGGAAGKTQTGPIVLVTHSDTVFPPEEERLNDFRYRESPEEGRIYGPGAVDNKGGTVLIWLMLQGMRAALPRLFEQTDWLVAANASEEVVATDFARLVKQRCPKGARAVLVFEGGPREGSQYQIVTGRKGRAEYRLIAHGRAAHAGSSHHEGANAIVALADAVMAAAAITDYASELTVNVATIQGGTVLNRVPHEAAAGIEVRAYETAALHEAATQLEAIADGRATANGRIHFDLECLARTAAWPQGERTMALYRHWERAAVRLGVTTVAIRRGGLSDANYLSDLGPTLDGLGPSGAHAHRSRRSPDAGEVPEFVEWDSLVIKAAMTMLALDDWLSTPQR